MLREFIQNNDYLIPLGLMGLVVGVTMLVAGILGLLGIIK